MGMALNSLGMINNSPHRSSTLTDTDIKLNAVQCQLWSQEWGVKQMVDVKNKKHKLYYRDRVSMFKLHLNRNQLLHQGLYLFSQIQYSHLFKFLKLLLLRQVMVLINLLCTVFCTKSLLDTTKFFPQPASVNGEKNSFTKLRWERW